MAVTDVHTMLTYLTYLCKPEDTVTELKVTILEKMHLDDRNTY